MMGVDTIKGVYQIAQAIYTQVQLVKANKSQCLRLSSRVKIVEDAVRKLETMPPSKDYEKGLEMLHTCLDDTLEFIKQFTDQKKWYQKAVYAQKNQTRFEELNKQLQECLPLLNLGIMVHQLSKREEDTADQKTDARALHVGQEKIISLNKKLLEELQVLKGAEAKRDKILVQQLASIRKALQLEPKPLIEARDRINYYELTFEELLGTGSVSNVYRGKWREKQAVAIKLFNVQLSDTAEFEREVKIMSRLRHSNIVQFYGACLEEGNACLVVELMEGRNLVQYMAEYKLDPLKKRRIALDIGNGLHYLHQSGIIHRDLKSLNILLTREGIAKITDFGMAKTQTLSIQSLGGKITQAVAWCAPELLLGSEDITTKADIYSFGTILWEIFTGQQPFAGLSLGKLTQKVLAGEREQLPETLPKGLGELIGRCWLADPYRRPEMAEINQWLEKYELDESLHYSQGKTLEKEAKHKEAKKAYQQAASLGSLSALNELGIYALKMPAKKADAYKLFLEGAQKGHLKSMRNLAIMLDKGDGIPADPKKALEWYEKAGDKESLARAKRLREKLSSSVVVAQPGLNGIIPGM